MEKRKTSATESNQEANTPLSSLSRRAFLAEAAATIAVGPALLRASLRNPAEPVFLHLAASSSHAGHIHTFAVTSVGCRLLGSTIVNDFAAFAVHPALPVLYVARDCRHWNGLPRGVVETYAVSRSATPLQLQTRTPMTLSATGPRSLAISSCGRHLLVSASTGGAWNTLALDHAGVPASVAIARKETGIVTESGTASLPAPHAVAFSPHALLAVATDLGCGHLTLLQPSPEEIAVLDRCQVSSALTAAPPVWTADGRYILAAAARNSSLLLYQATAIGRARQDARIRMLAAVPTATAVTALVAHPAKPAVFTSRVQGSGSILETWEIQGDQLQLTNSRWLANRLTTLAHEGDGLWSASNEHLVRISMRDLRASSFKTPLQGDGGEVQAIVTQRLSV